MKEAGRPRGGTACFVGSQVSEKDFQSLRSFGDLLFFDINAIFRSVYTAFDNSAPDSLFGPSFEPLRNAAAVWYHPGSFEESEFGFVENDTQFGYVRRQFAKTVSFLEWWMERHCLCVDRPSVQRLWSNKLIQLASFTDGDPRFPKTTLCATMPAIERASVVKHISESRILSSDRLVFTRDYTEADRCALSVEDRFPILIQEKIDSRYEYRAFVFGCEQITIQFDRFLLAGGVDIHSSTAAFDQAAIVETPQGTRQILSRIQEVTQLRYLAVDYMVNDGGFRVLEINPLFSWSGLPTDLSSQVARMAFSNLMVKYDWSNHGRPKHGA